MEPITITDSSFEDFAHILDYSLDMAYGSDEQDFQLDIGNEPRLEPGSIFYIDGTEYGGIIDGVKADTASDSLQYIGRCWTGILAGKIIEPPSGSAYRTVSGDANSVLASLVNLLDVGAIFYADTDPSGITISYQFARYVDAYSGIKSMLASHGAKLKMKSGQGGRVKLWAEPVSTYSDTVDSNLMDFKSERTYRSPNHLVCLGQGEGTEREIVHFYADSEGNISQTQTLFGLDEVALTYDYNNADRDELLKSGQEKLAEMQAQGSIEADILSQSVDIGDILVSHDNLQNVLVSATVSKKIIKTDSGILVAEYETEKPDTVSSVVSGGDTPWMTANGKLFAFDSVDLTIPSTSSQSNNSVTGTVPAKAGFSFAGVVGYSLNTGTRQNFFNVWRCEKYSDTEVRVSVCNLYTSAANGVITVYLLYVSESNEG